MTKEELAAQLNGIEYPVVIADVLFQQAKDAGLVIVFSASDDLMEFAGAIYEEIGAYGGVSVDVDDKGILPEFEYIATNKNKDALRDYFQREGKSKTIEAKWDGGDGYSWTYETEIPHATFEVVEDGDRYCRGIVFSLSDLGVTP